MKCSLCNQAEEDLKQKIGKTTHLFCPNCYKIYKESVEVIKNIVDQNPEADEVVIEEAMKRLEIY